MKSIFVVGALAIALVSMAVAADFWTSKPYTKWSQSDAVKMLTDSPWAKTTTLSMGVQSQSRRGRSGVPEIDETQARPIIRYAVSLRSALPVRQASLRLAALEKKYDKMDETAKKLFDDDSKNYLDADYSDVIVFTVNYQSNDPSMDRQLLTYFQAQTLETLKTTTTLTLTGGKKLQPLVFASAPHEMQIAFARPKGLDAASSFTFEFQHPDVNGQSSRRINAKFALKEMAFDGAPVF